MSSGAPAKADATPCPTGQDVGPSEPRDSYWDNPLAVIPLRAGYEFRKYALYGPYLLCLDGRPVEAEGKSGNLWHVCQFDPGPSAALEKFALAMRGP